MVFPFSVYNIAYSAAGRKENLMLVGVGCPLCDLNLSDLLPAYSFIKNSCFQNTHRDTPRATIWDFKDTEVLYQIGQYKPDTGQIEPC